MTKMIVGLGNPGDKYKNTKHNMGFMALDQLAEALNLSFSMDKTFQSEIASAFINNEKIYFVKPMTYMNESGRAVGPLLSYYGLTDEDLTVVHDDLDSPVGRVRLRTKGSSGGQNGVKSIIAHVGSQEFNRVKIGIGRPKHGMTVVNHVLSTFDDEDESTGLQGIDNAVKAIEYYLESNDFMKTMNKFNG
ncbi:MAG: aminoacyl-tRNA hydrolase [Streptococcaceae bacterium]|nr:aminoacyl-tRNA hydrolase [Streptococcaceae bacterium]